MRLENLYIPLNKLNHSDRIQFITYLQAFRLIKPPEPKAPRAKTSKSTGKKMIAVNEDELAALKAMGLI